MAGPVSGKGLDRLSAELLRNEAQGRQREVVIGLVAGGSPGLGEREHVAGATPSPLGRRAVRGPVMGHHQTLLDEGGEVTTYAC